MADKKVKFINSDNESDDDAPEVVTATQSKAKALEQERTIKSSDAKLKQRRKEANRLRDQALKRRAEETKGPSKRVKLSSEEHEHHSKGRTPKSRADERMRKAMGDARGEDSGEESPDGGLVHRTGYDEDGDGDEDGSGHEEADEDSIYVEESSRLKDAKWDSAKYGLATEDYLDDDLFTAAFKAQEPKIARSDSLRSSSPLEKKRKRRKPKAKDMIIGSATIKMLPKPSPVPSNIKGVPSGKMNRYVKDSLGLRSRGVNKKLKGWERRPANVGVLRGSGPAANFVRKS